MAQSYITEDGVLIIPDAYAKVKLEGSPSASGTAGVVALVGEASGGPAYSEEEDLALNTYGPDQFSDFVAKYRSGPLVDAFRGALAASNDPQITGSFNRIVAIKTNASTKSTGSLPVIGGASTYANVSAKSSGKSGNQVSISLTQETAESYPTTGPTILCPPTVGTTVGIRVNGGALLTATLSAGDSPTVMRSSIDALAGVSASGGVNRNIISVATGSLSLAIVSGLKVTFTISTAFANLPSPGDILYVPAGSPFAAANEGTYVVLSATGTTITAHKVLDAVGASNALTQPVAEGPLAIAAITDMVAYSPVTITLEPSVVVPGLGKSLEIAKTTTGDFNDIAYTFMGATSLSPALRATWVSTSTTPTSIASVAEYSVKFNASRNVEDISDDVVVPGFVPFAMGYIGTTASATIADGRMTTTVSGGVGAALDIALSEFTSLSDLVAYISAQPGYSASTTSPASTSLSLDPGTYSIATTHGAKNGRIKADGKAFADAVNNGTSLVSVGPASGAKTLIGLPGVLTTTYLVGGAWGGTSDTDIANALDTLHAVKCNFVVPLFSRDATADIADSITSTTSTYTIDAINTLVKAHCLTASQLKRKRNRQGFVSFKGAFSDARSRGANMASSRMVMFFQDVKDVNAAGQIKTFAPWMLAVKAASMQAAGGYRPLVRKMINITGISALGYTPSLGSHIENALTSGLCPVAASDDGGFYFVSDQTTYGKNTRDIDFVLNSFQAIYTADLISQSVSQGMANAFVGQSIADVSATLAKSTMERLLDEERRLKRISPSDDAKSGYKPVVIKIVGGVMTASVEVKLAGAIYFVPITITVTPVVQSA